MAEAGPQRSQAGWTEQVRHAAPVGYAGPWPRLSVWHGEADRVVDPANARLLAEQWSGVHGLESSKVIAEPFGVRREIWGKPELPAIELWTLPSLAHCWPTNASSQIADFWSLPRN